MTEDPTSNVIRKVDSAQTFIKTKYCDTIGLATSILGQVLLGTIKGTKRKKEVIKLCLKDMKQQFADRVAEDPSTEIEFMNVICNRGHPNFVRFIDAVEDHKLYCLCIEYVSGGDMCTYIQNLRHGLPIAVSKKYAIQLTKAVYFMHCNGYCHLDLSLENVLWDKKNDLVKLCDFGLARKFPNNDITASFNAATIRPGKKGYMAPEIYAYQKFNGEKADVFSLGVLIFILLTGFPPFTTPNASDKCFQYMYYGKLEWLLKQWKLNDIIDADCRDLLSKILCHPKKRISIKDMLEHPWFDQNVSDIDDEMEGYKMRMDVGSNIDAIPPTLTSNVDPNTTSNANNTTTASKVVKGTTTTSLTKKRKSIPSIVKKKRKSKTMKKAKELMKEIDSNKVSMTKKRGKRPKSKSIADIHNFGDLYIDESQTVLSEFAATVTVEPHKTSNKFNNKSRSKSLSYSYSSYNSHSHSIHSLINGLKQKDGDKSKQTSTTQMRRRRSSKSSALRDESPISTMSNHSNHSHQSNQSNHSNQSQQDDYKSGSSPAKISKIDRNHSDIHNDANMRDGGNDNAPSPVPISDGDHAQQSQLNDTQLITKKLAMLNQHKHALPHHNINNNGNFNINDNHNDHVDAEYFDNDRKEGDDETYPYSERNSVTSADEERRLSITSQDVEYDHHGQDMVSNKASDDQHSNNNNNAPKDDDDSNTNKTTSHLPV